jgi:hypothetical protein
MKFAAGSGSLRARRQMKARQLKGLSKCYTSLV